MPKATAGSDGGRSARAHLDVSIPAPVGRDRAAAILGLERGAWLGTSSGDGTPAPAGMERHLIDLQMRTAAQSPLITFHKAAYLDLGPVRDDPDAVSLEVSWRAAGMAPLFPVFSGRLTWSHDQLRVTGFYAPPGGSVGMVADRLLLRVAARGTARWLLGRIAAAMGTDGSGPEDPG